MARNVTAHALLVLLLPAAAAAAGKPSRQIVEFTDPYTGLKQLTLTLATGTCSLPSGETRDRRAEVRLLITADQTPDGETLYAVVVDLTGGYALQPGRSGTLSVLADGVHSELPVAERRSKWREHVALARRHHYLREEMPFAASEEFLDSITSAESLQFRVNGSNGSLERCTDARELLQIRELLGRAATF